MRRLRKKPIQIYISFKQDGVLRLISQKRGISVAAVIRESLDKYIENLPLENDPALELIGLGWSSKRDLSYNHDRYLTKYNKSKKE